MMAVAPNILLVSWEKVIAITTMNVQLDWFVATTTVRGATKMIAVENRVAAAKMMDVALNLIS